MGQWQDKTSTARRIRKFEQWLLGEEGDARRMTFYYPCVTSDDYDFDAKRTQLEQRLSECVGLNGLSISYGPSLFRGKQAIAVELTGQALRNYRELDHERQVSEPQPAVSR